MNTKRQMLPKQQIKLTFVTNKWNDNLSSAIIDGRNVADITFYPSQGLMPNVIDEGFYFSRQSAEARANWRVNL